MELAILTREGRYAEALEFDCHRSTAMETVSYSEFDRAFCHLRLGRKEEAMPHLERLESISDIDMDAAADTGILHAHLGDADSADIMTEISRGTDKWLWFVEAHQQGESL